MNNKILRYALPFVIAASLSALAYWRGAFSVDVISVPLKTVGLEVGSSEIHQALSQSYHFLGAGRQSFAFVSEDGKTVLKFFNRKYFQLPWYIFALRDPEKEEKKREQREFFYLKSYALAEKFLREQTGLLYVHFGKTEQLGVVHIKDQASRVFSVDLNRVPFVLQKKGEPFYSALQEIQKERGDGAFLAAIDDFLHMIAYRISLGISDHDHDVEHNFGFLDGKPLHFDPGRLSLCDLSSESSCSYEWWAATHSLRKWIQEEYPDLVSPFDRLLVELKTRSD